MFLYPQYFNNEKFEADRYDFILKKFEQASSKPTSSLALLNFTQNGIFSIELNDVIYLEANKIAWRGHCLRSGSGKHVTTKIS
ncbi:hypothetical protein V3C99_004698 [Haemonchus contortus]